MAWPLLFVLAGPAWPQPAATGFCAVPLDIPPRPVLDTELAPGETYITANDQGEMTEGGLATLSGMVEVSRNDWQIRADRMSYDQASGALQLDGGVQYWDRILYLHGEHARVDSNNDSGSFASVDYHISTNRGRGHADELAVVSGSLIRGSDIDYTTCDTEAAGHDLSSNTWRISASDLTLDRDQDRGTARHAVLRVKDVPVFYTPYLSFPLSDARKTGFLFPSVGSSRRNGFEFQTPWYWNIAPNMDATITPRLLSNSGMMLMGEYRYLFPGASGYINGEFLPGDDSFNDEDRSLISYEHHQTFRERAGLYLLFNNVSDKRYFEDFGLSQASTSTQFLQRRAQLSYSGDNWGAYALVQNFQVVDDSLPLSSRPYRRLPQVFFKFRSPASANRFNYQVQSEAVYFDRGGDPQLADVNGLRLDLTPSIWYPLRTAAAFLTPKLGLRYTGYHLDGLPGMDDSVDRLLPFASIDGGLLLEREVTLYGREHLQTLEPRLYYLYVPEDEQNDLPVFDTGIYDFSFDSMFYENRFAGGDRFGDANQVTLSVTSRLFSGDGAETGHVSIGQTFYLRDRKVVLPGQPVQTETFSPLVAEIGTTLFHDLQLRGELEWEPNDNITQKLVLRAQYRPSGNRVVNLAYRVRRAAPGVIRNDVLDVEQTDLSFHWPVTANWSVVGRWNYALPENRTLDLFGGLEYEGCCWGMRVVGRRFLSTLEGEYQNGVFMQFELKGLAGIGQKTVDFLSENIPGYSSEF